MSSLLPCQSFDIHTNLREINQTTKTFSHLNHIYFNIVGKSEIWNSTWMYVGIAWTLRVGLATYSSTLDTISRMTCLGKRYLLIRSMSCILSKALFLSRNTLSLLKRLRSRLCIMSKVAIIVNRLYLRPNKSRRRLMTKI